MSALTIGIERGTGANSNAALRELSLDKIENYLPPARSGAPIQHSDWQIKNLTGIARPPLSARDYVGRFLEAVTVGRLLKSKLFEMMSSTHSNYSDDDFHYVPAELLTHYRNFLAAVVRQPGSIKPKVCMDLALGVRQKVVAIPEPGISPSGEFEMGYRIVTLDDFAVFEYANVLLLANFVTDLCQCHLPSCGKFFLADQSPVGGAGRIRREYCSERHRSEYLDWRRAEHVRAKRAGEPLEKWLDIIERNPGITPGKWKEKKGRQRK